MDECLECFGTYLLLLLLWSVSLCGVSRITSYPQAKEYHKGLRSKEKDWKVCHSLALMIGSHTNIVQDLCARKDFKPVTKLLPGDWAEEAKFEGSNEPCPTERETGYRSGKKKTAGGARSRGSGSEKRKSRE